MCQFIFGKRQQPLRLESAGQQGTHVVVAGQDDRGAQQGEEGRAGGGPEAGPPPCLE